MSNRPKIVVLGMMSVHPVGGVIWQTLHYLVGFRRLGYDAYYVEASGHQPSYLLGDDDGGSRSSRAAAFIDETMRRFDLAGRWAFHALADDGRCYGLSQGELRRLYRDAELVINLHGGTVPRPEHYETDRLVYLETDPVAIQLEVHRNDREAVEYLEPHCAFFTFGENIGHPDCRLPTSERFEFKPTRQPVVLDLWDNRGRPPREVFTTVGNWRQSWRDVVFEGETYTWTKHVEFEKFLELPVRTGVSFELALSQTDAEARRLLQTNGWRVCEALQVSRDTEDYRHYIVSSRAEFTVAKDQNVRLRTGWFSDRSATYLAAGRPVVTQDTAFHHALPTGRGLFSVSDVAEAAASVEEIASDVEGQSAAASDIAREYFAAERVLARLLADLGVGRVGIASRRTASASL